MKDFLAVAMRFNSLYLGMAVVILAITAPELLWPYFLFFMIFGPRVVIVENTNKQTPNIS